MIRIDTLGGFSVRNDDGSAPAGAATQPRRMAILAILARAGERGVNRERLVALLWPDADDERAPRALAQALYALRKDLGAEDAITGSKELRFDPALVSTDLGEFAAAIARGSDARAVEVYHGPFLDGFHVPGADQFARWVETERATLVQQYARALESLARAARQRGDAAESVAWWRKLAALEPLNARVTVGLMETLAASGDRAAALKHVEIYQLLLEQELDLPPDHEVLATAQRIRRGEIGAVPGPPSAPTLRSETAPDIVAGAAVDSPPARPASHRRTLAAGLITVAVVALAFAFRRSDRDSFPVVQSGSVVPVVAVGRVASFGSDSGQAMLAAPVADLLATSLARATGIRVVSQGRMLELMRSSAGDRDTSAGAFVDAARRAGAAEVIDGTLYARPGGRLRLDLRRVDLASGAIRDVRTTEGNDLFALVDSGTARILGALGAERPAGSIADVTTRSVTAYRMYERGIRAFYQGDARTALGFFDAALSEDSLFALAAYYGALAAGATDPDDSQVRLNRARALASRASDRERLIIIGGWAYHTASPSLRAIAETLVVRYPTEVEGHLYTGIARVSDGEFLASIAPLERVIAMDSAGLRGAAETCAACDASRWLVEAYALADSFPAAERAARRWLRMQPASALAALELAHALEGQDRAAEADSLARAWADRDPSGNAALSFRPQHLIRIGDYAGADRLLIAQTLVPNAARQADAYWSLALSLRAQGKLAAAYDAARQARRFVSDGSDRGPPSTAVLEAQIQLERGNSTTAGAIFDSLARQRSPDQSELQVARHRAWLLTQVAQARVAQLDTAALRRLADTIRVLGAESGYARDRRMYHHVLGLLAAARGDDARAIAEFPAAIYSTTLGYTRTNYELARVYLRQKRPRDAIALLQSALRGPLDASNLYVSRTELHELLAQAWDAAGVKDSAAAHYRIVIAAWASADSSLGPRVRAAKLRIAALAR